MKILKIHFIQEQCFLFKFLQSCSKFYRSQFIVLSFSNRTVEGKG